MREGGWEVQMQKYLGVNFRPRRIGREKVQKVLGLPADMVVRNEGMRLGRIESHEAESTSVWTARSVRVKRHDLVLS